MYYIYIEHIVICAYVTIVIEWSTRKNKILIYKIPHFLNIIRNSQISSKMKNKDLDKSSTLIYSKKV